MVLRILMLFALFTGAQAATLEEGIAALRGATAGSIAFCKPSIVDELQIIGSPRRLSPEEARELGKLLGSEETYFGRTANGELTEAHSLCLPHWDFKILLFDKDGHLLAALRLCSGCHQVALSLDGSSVNCPDIREPAMAELAKHFDSWFPGWAKTTERNRAEWGKAKRGKKAR